MSLKNGLKNCCTFTQWSITKMFKEITSLNLQAIGGNRKIILSEISQTQKEKHIKL